MRIQIAIRRTGQPLTALIPASAAALANGINRTLEEAQIAQQASVAQNFVDRRPPFLSRMVKIAPSDRAQPDRLIGRIRIAGPNTVTGIDRVAPILTRHEDGGVRVAPGGYSADPSVRIGGFFYIPTDVIRSPFSAIVPKSLYPTNLRLVARRDVSGTLAPKVHTTARGVMQVQGSRRTFVLFGASGGAPIGIFQRNGGGGIHARRGRSRGRHAVFRAAAGATRRDDITEIWRFRRQVTLKPRLHFYEIVPRTINERLVLNYTGMLPQQLGKLKLSAPIQP